jgi:hypothetical protein
MKYQLEYFITRNTSCTEDIDVKSFDKVRAIAKRLSFTNEMPVVAIDGHDFAKYEHSQCLEATNANWLS